MPTPEDKNGKTEQGNRGRRTTLKTILTGGGVVTLGALPGQWVKPVVDAVSLPVHAQTSPGGTGGGGGRARNGFMVGAMGASAPGWLDKIVPTAHASEVFTPTSGFLCIEGDEGIAASFQVDDEIVLRTSGGVGDCLNLFCSGSAGAYSVDLLVHEVRPDGRFRFSMYDSTDGSCEGSPIVTDETTDTPCNLLSEICGVEQKEGP